MLSHHICIGLNHLCKAQVSLRVALLQNQLYKLLVHHFVFKLFMGHCNTLPGNPSFNKLKDLAIFCVLMDFLYYSMHMILNYSPFQEHTSSITTNPSFFYRQLDIFNNMDCDQYARIIATDLKNKQTVVNIAICDIFKQKGYKCYNPS